MTAPLFDHDLAALLRDLTAHEVNDLVESLPPSAAALMLNELDKLNAQAADPLSLLSIAERVLPAYHPREHTDLLAARLTRAVERAEAGEDVRLVVELPPGAGKSSVCSVAFPLWAMARHPDWETVLVSAEASLATKFSRDCRRAITSGLVPGVTISADSQAVTEWETTAGGSFVARGVGGQVTGRRARILLIDDPVKNLADASSKVYRERLWDAWQSVLKPRLRAGSVVVLVMTRWHTDDLAGRLLSKSVDAEWEEIRLPAIAEDNDPMGREPGEPLLSPQTDEDAKQALERWDQARAEVGSYVWDALYQQRPSPPGGTTFHSDWWQWHTDLTRPDPGVGEWVSSWDLTFGSRVGDYAVGQVWQLFEGTAYLIDQRRGRWGFNETLAQIRDVAEAYPQIGTHLIEKAAAGPAAIDTLKREIVGVIAVPPRGSKKVRAQAVAPMVEAGQVSLPSDRAWTSDLLGELNGFPAGVQHDDQVDALTQALDRLGKPRGGQLLVSTATPSSPVGSRSSSLGAIRRGGF